MSEIGEIEGRLLSTRIQRTRALSACRRAQVDAHAAIRDARRAGMSLRAIASLSGYTFARIRQIEQES